MSRIGKLPITVPAGVTVDFKDGVVTVKGPKGTLTQEVAGGINIKTDAGVCTVEKTGNDKTDEAKWGLYRSLVHNMVVGVTDGYVRKLKIAGIGWKAAMQGNRLVLNVGYSHPVNFDAPEGIKLECESPTVIKVSGIDKAAVGQVASDIRKVRVPEPYHGFGIAYEDEVIQRKEGKTGGKGKK